MHPGKFYFYEKKEFTVLRRNNESTRGRKYARGREDSDHEHPGKAFRGLLDESALETGVFFNLTARYHRHVGLHVCICEGETIAWTLAVAQ